MKGTTVLKGFLLLIAAVFVVHQCVSAFYSPVKTESAVFYNSSDGLNITGLIIRNETLVTSQSNGVMHFIVGDGTRVAKNGVIANIYDSESASITLSQIDSVKKKITDLEDLLSYNDLEAADLDLINARIEESLNNFVVNSSTGDYNGIEQYSSALLSSVNRRTAAMGNTADFSSQLNSLKSQLNELSSSLPNAKGQVKADQSGYFVSKTDGYENVLTCDNLDKINSDYINGLKAQETPDNVIGKIVSDYEWYIAAKVSINESLNFKEGDTLKLYTTVKSYPQLPVTVKQINISENSADAVIIFACSEMNSELAAMRSGPMTAVKKEYSGLKVSKNALRVVDSKRGVYVLSGMQVKFVPVNVLYSNDSYIICEKQTADGNVLKLYDEVIVNGKNLYDGKIIS